MIASRPLHRGHNRLKPLIDLALREGWDVARTCGGHLTFTKPGLPPIHTSATASDHSAGGSAVARLRRAAHTGKSPATNESARRR